MDTTANYGLPKPAYDDSGAANASTFANQMDTADSSIYNAVAAKINKSIGTTKGDLIVYTTSGNPVRKALGVDGQYLKVNTAATDGLSYDEPVDWTQGTHGQYLKRDTSATDGYSFDVPVGAGDVVGPSSATDRAISLFDGTGGKTLQESLATIDTAGSINIPSGQTYDIDGSAHTHSGMVYGPSSSTDNQIVRYDGTSGTIQASSIILNDSADLTSFRGLLLDPGTIADDAYQGLVKAGTAGEALTQWDVVYLKSDGKYWKAQADSDTTCPAHGIAVAAADAEDPVTLLWMGCFRDDGGVEMTTIGGIIYLDPDTAGAMTPTMPSSTGEQVCHLGYALSAQVRMVMINSATAEVP